VLVSTWKISIFHRTHFLVTRKRRKSGDAVFPQEVADALLAYIEERKEIIPLKGHEEALFLSLQKRRITQRAVHESGQKYALLAAPLKKRISPIS
jgi:site-specific recombinase XerD